MKTNPIPLEQLPEAAASLSDRIHDAHQHATVLDRLLMGVIAHLCATSADPLATILAIGQAAIRPLDDVPEEFPEGRLALEQRIAKLQAAILRWPRQG